jgi:site-specific recombinase XerD
MTLEAVKALAFSLVAAELEGDRTTKRYRNIIQHNAEQFFLWLGSRKMGDIKTVGKKELFEYYQHICAERTTTGTRNVGGLLSSATINWRLLGVKKRFAALYRVGYVDRDPLYGLKLDIPSGRSYKRRPFTEAEITEFLEQIDPSTEKGLRDRAMFELMYSSGLRVGEVSRLTIADIDLKRREIIVHGKGSRDRVVPLSEVARDFLLLHIGERINRLEEPVFYGRRAGTKGKAITPDGISQRFETFLVRFEMHAPGRSPHAVRHSTATHLLDHGASIRHIQELLGHRNIDTTVRYTQVQTGGLAKVFRKYHPGEHELFEAIDEAYIKRLDALVAGKEAIC